jgi:hypothetical protein
MAQQKGIRHTRGYDDDFHKEAYGCVSIYICTLTDLGGAFRPSTLKAI